MKQRPKTRIFFLSLFKLSQKRIGRHHHEQNGNHRRDRTAGARFARKPDCRSGGAALRRRGLHGHLPQRRIHGQIRGAGTARRRHADLRRQKRAAGLQKYFRRNLQGAPRHGCGQSVRRGSSAHRAGRHPKQGRARRKRNARRIDGMCQSGGLCAEYGAFPLSGRHAGASHAHADDEHPERRRAR